jgi:tRNA(Arg) A34 adenosine deaminase TadA
VIVKNGEVIAIEANRVRLDNDPTSHAEVLAIRAACKRLGTHNLKGCTIYSSSEPCPMCLGAIYWAGLDRLVFSNNKKEAEKAGFIDAHIYREIALQPDQRDLPSLRIELPEAGSEFLAWMKKEDKKSY